MLMNYDCDFLQKHKFVFQITFEEKEGGSGQLLTDSKKDSHASTKQEVYCFPFYSLMLALNVSHIDYFSLDVEGHELRVLKTIPFDRIDISVLTVEYLHGNKQAIIKFMTNKGYVLTKTLHFSKASIFQWSYDYVFVKETLTVI